MKVRVSYGINKLQEGLTYHEKHILDDLKALLVPATREPVAAWPAGNTIAVDTEYAKDGDLLTVSFANKSQAHAWEFDGAVPGIEDVEWLIGHNVPGDIDQLAKNGFRVKEDWYTGRKIIDSLVLAKMIDENKPKGSYGLEPLMLTTYNFQPWKGPTDEKFKETGDARDWTPEERKSRCRTDAWASFMVAKKYFPLVAHDQQTRTLVETIHRISMTLYRIGLAGAKVDRTYLDLFNVNNARDAAVHEGLLRSEAVNLGWDKPEPFSPTKDDDIRYLLFDKAGLEPLAHTKSGKAAVDKVVLKQYTDDLPIFIPGLLAYNKAHKLYSIYKDIPDYIDEHGFIHFWINQLGARTGRRSSGGGEEGTPSAKNWQNAPPEAKHMIVSRFPGGKIGAFDYQSLEPILAAWISKDANLFDFFYNGRGYLDICKRILGQDIDKTSKIYRAIKNMTLGVFYNMQAPKMAKNLWQILDFKFSEDYDEHEFQTAKTRKQILGLFPGWVRYMERQKIKLANDGQIVAPDGYVRHLPHHGPNSPKYWGLINQAINFPIQHLASMVTGCAMVDCEAVILSKYNWTYAEWQSQLHQVEDQQHMPSVLINEVHDELTWDINPMLRDVDEQLILATMAEPPSLKKLIPDFDIKLKIEPKISDRW